LACGQSSWISEDPTDAPEAATPWQTWLHAAGTPTLTAAVSDSNQVIAAVHAGGLASNLVRASNVPGSTGRGAVAAVAQTSLAHGAD
jgi:hypothetical protein